VQFERYLVAVPGLTERQRLFSREPLEVIQHGGNEFLSAGVLRGEGSGKNLEQIACLLGSFTPICRGRCNQVRLQFVLSKAQGFFIGLHACQQAAQVRGLLRGHTAMLIQVDRFFRHGCAPEDAFIA
jgi:hypothetical protein